MMVDDEYFWSKNSRPTSQKDQDRNMAANYVMRHLKTENVILKTLHFDLENELAFQKFDTSDFTPFVRYSINKQKRWDIEKEEFLEKAKARHNGLEVVLLDRVNLSSALILYAGRTLLFENFPIRRILRIRCDDSLEKLSTSTVWGQPYRHFQNSKTSLEDEKEEIQKLPETEVIAYHFLTPPRNFETLLKNDFCPGKDRIGHRTNKHWRRIKKRAEASFHLRYEVLEDQMYQFNESDDSCDEISEQPRKFYDLDEHIVDKYVMVNRR